MSAKWKCEEHETENGLINLRIVLDGEPLGWLITPPGLPKKNTRAYNEAIKRAKLLIEACNTNDAFLKTASEVIRIGDNGGIKNDTQEFWDAWDNFKKVIAQARTEKEPYEKPAIHAGTSDETE